MSTATTLVTHDHTLGNASELLNHMCFLVIARGDVTPFDAASIQEEDIIEFCVEVGQTCHKGVLWLLVIESVILFCSSKEMMDAAYGSPRPRLGMRNILNFLFALPLLPI